MKLKITLSSNRPISLPLHHNRALQGFIYANLGLFASFFHDFGIPVSGRLLKPLTFSRLFGRSRIDRERKRALFKPPVYFYFSSLFEEVLSTYATILLKKPFLKLGRNLVQVEKIEVIEERVSGNEAVVKTLSPIVVRKTVEGKSLYLNPGQEEFYRLLAKNLAKKSRLYAGREVSPEEIEIEPAPGAFFKKAVVYYKGYPYEAYKGKFLIRAPKEAIETALLTGLGERNSQGFGMVIVDGEPSGLPARLV